MAAPAAVRASVLALEGDRRSMVARRGARGAVTWRVGIPFCLLHLSCLAVLWVGWSEAAVVTCIVMYLTRMFGITAFYHRCFSHRAFQVSRRVQFAGAVLGAAAAQRGPLWWAAHHRRHHRRTDRPGDPHSPVRDGFTYSHLLWLFDRQHQATAAEVVPDLARFGELRLLDRFHHVVPALTAVALFGVGTALGWTWPQLGTSGPQLVIWGFVISTVALYQATFAVNSIAHVVGSRPFATRDTSGNNWWLALLTLGEGWHNNHHRCPGAARAGFTRWQLDPTWLALRALRRFGLVKGLRPVPDRLMPATSAPSTAGSGSR